MKLFVTGATGFLGSHVLDFAVARGHTVRALVRPGSDTWRIAHALGKVTLVAGDLRDAAALHQALASDLPDAVLHLAWGGVAGSQRNEDAQTQNIAETLTLVEACKRAGVRKFVGLGSQGEFGPHQATLDETALPQPTTLYGAAKLSAHHLTRVTCELAGLEWAWLRLFSSYGPRDNPGWLIPYMTLQLLRGHVPALTAGEQRWDYIYGPDAATAIVAVAEHREAQGTFNLGSGEAPMLRTIVEAVRDSVDPQLALGFGEVPYRPDQVMFLCADIGRLRTLAKWQPQTTLQVGIAQTVEWFREHKHRYDA